MTIYLVGTSHIARESLKKVRAAIEEKKPDCVAVELDANRFHALKSRCKRKTELRLPLLQKLIFTLMQKLQDKIGRETNIFAGQEMLNAVKIAEEKGIPYYFIDQDISITVDRLMREMSFFAKIKFLFYLAVGFVGVPVPGLSAPAEIDLNKVPEEEFIEEAMDELKKQFPAIYKVLVLERNRHMAKNIKALGERYENVVAVLGAGHVKGIGRILENA